MNSQQQLLFSTVPLHFNILDAKKTNENANKYQKIAICAGAGVLGFTLQSGLLTASSRERAVPMVRDRTGIPDKIMALSENLFKRMYRLDKNSFLSLLELIRPEIEADRNDPKVREDSVDPLIKLAIALRMLAGGSYLDIAFCYNVHPDTVYKHFGQVLNAIDEKLQNIVFPYNDEEKMREVEGTFLKYCKGAFPGTVAAGDGIVFRMMKPRRSDVGDNARAFFTRKGFYAHALQAFVDGNCKFVLISMKVAASTHDATAYVLSEMSDIIKRGDLPAWAHIVLDEAYKCTGQEISPWKGKKLSTEKDTFNYYLSLHRQCVERAFGLLVGRWGIFWRPLRFGLQRNSQVISVCCKLHNLCTDKFGSNSNSYEIYNDDLHWKRKNIDSKEDQPDSTVLYTDGTGLRQGARTDLWGSNHRDTLTQRLANLKLSRPVHSQLQRKLRRIKDV